MSTLQRGKRIVKFLASIATSLVFTFLDLLDLLLCFFYRFMDTLLDGHAHPCYCWDGEERRSVNGDGHEGRKEEDEVSETLCGRKNVFRDMGFGNFLGRDWRREGGSGAGVSVRWSDCGCESCVAWQVKGNKKLHYVVREPSQGQTNEECNANLTENVIFLHGFLCSSSMWVETVFKNSSLHAKQNCRLIAVDLLGFGESPKPTECLYRLNDHVQMIEKSIIEPLQLKSFHLVAHSMGCIIALALAAKNKESVKSLALVAPPYFPSPKDEAGHIALNKLAGRKLWPPILFGSAVMSWYEHLGRSVCFLLCRNHGKWESILKLATRKRNLHFMILDLTKHTHHSAWHTMHNVICGGAKFMDEYLETLNKSEISIKMIHGGEDRMVPPECSSNMKLKIPFSELQNVTNVDHNTVIFGRERDFTKDLEEIWLSSARPNPHSMR